MGKHLAPKPKHELNFIKKKPQRASAQRPAAHALDNSQAAAQSQRRAAHAMGEIGAYAVGETGAHALGETGAHALGETGAHALGEGRSVSRGERRAAARSVKLPSFRVRLPRKLPSFGAHAWVFPALAAVLLAVVRLLPLEGWMVPAACGVPALLALAEHAADAYDQIRAGRWLNSPLLTCLAALLLFCTGLYVEAVLLPVLTSFARLAEKALYARCEADRARIAEILPREVSLVTDAGVERVAPEAVAAGDILLVAAGERIPLDGVVTEGITTIDTAAVSGQRSPWAVNVGYKVYSGCRNLTSDIKIRVSRPYEQSTAGKLVRIAGAAPDFLSEQESRSTQLIRYYTPAAAALALLLGVVLPAFRGGWAVHLQRAAVMLMAARPLTERLSLPLLYCRALTLATGFGVFVKGGDCLEAIAKAETVIFDKTGTITEGRYAVTDVYPVKMSERQLLTIAATAESFSRHPIAFAIREAAEKLNDRAVKSVKVREIPGRGISAFVGTHQVYVGNAALLEEHGVKYNIPSRPGTAVHVSVDSRYCGYILVTDKVRRRAFDALETLRVNGIKKLVLLTGDVMSVARPIASRLNFDVLRAELTPEGKAHAVNYLMKNKGARSTIVFVGDGENSGRIMTGADVGVAMGSLGSDAAFVSADVLIMDKDVFKLPKLLTLSRLVYRAAWENLALGGGVSALILLFGALGLFSPLAAELIFAAGCAALLANTLRIK